MAVLIVSTQNQTITTTWNGSSYDTTISYTVPSGADILLARLGGAIGFSRVSSVDYNGIVGVRRVKQETGNLRAVELWDVDSPTVGTYNLVIDTGGVARTMDVCISCLTGTDIGGTPRGASGFSATGSVAVATAVDDFVADVFLVETSSDAAPGAGQTSQMLNYGGGYTNASTETATTTSTTMSWTYTAGPDAIVAQVYKPAASQSITSINGGSAVTDGQTSVAVVASGFSGLPTAGVYDDDATGNYDTTVTSSLAGTATNFTFDTQSVKDLTVATLGSPFTTASHALSATFTYSAETADGAFTLNPATNWHVVEVASPITTIGSLFYVAGGWDLAAPANADQVYYYSTEISTDTDPAYFVIAADGTITTNISTGTVAGAFFDQTYYTWWPFTVQLGVLGGSGVLGFYSLVANKLKR